MNRRNYEPACSGVVLYLGLNRRYEQLLHHNFVFSHDPHEEFDYIYRRGEPAPDPTCYVCARPSPNPRWPPTVEKRSMFWCTHPICDRTTIGIRCCPSIDRRS